MSNKRTLLLVMGGLLLAAPLALAGAAGEAAAAEPVTLTVWTTANVEAFPDGQNENNNEIHSFLQEQIGYQLDWLIGSREEQLAKLSLLIASGDPPDLMTPLPPSFFGELIEQRVLLPLDDLIDSHGAVFNTIVPESLWASAKAGGQLFGVPQEGAVQSHGGPLMRQDWLEEAGLEAPVTVEDYVNVLRAFKRNHPDSIPMTGNAWGVRGGISPFCGYYGACTTFIERDGKVVDTRVQPETRELLALLRGLVEEGLLDQEYVINKGQQINEKVASGKVGMWSSSPWSLRDLLPAFEENNPGARYLFIAPAVDRQGQAGVRQREPVRGFSVIAVDSEHPEEAMDFLAQYAGREDIQDFVSYGIENVHYTVRDDGLKEVTPEAETRKYNIYYVAWNTVQGHLDRAKLKHYWPVYEPTFKYSLYPEIVAYAPPIKAYEEVKQSLTDLTNETFDKIILGQLPLAAFDDYVQQWEKLGGATALKAVADWWASVQ
jgi:putative aldouronate transport system substrate-binding protein